MLDLLGSGYVMEHCLAAFRKKMREELYQTYITDIARFLAIRLGATSVKRYYEYLHPPKEERRSAGEIVADIAMKAGLKEVSSNERIESDGDAGA